MPTVLESLNSGLKAAFEADPSVYLLGEDILDPYGGAFKVTRGLSSAFPDRVLTTPVSEAGITGLAAGMALRGLRPVVEIMFGDFITLAADQLVNHISRYRWMYNEQVQVPLVIRTPMGGRRGYGPTHSQTLEKHFLGVPGLSVLAANSFTDPGELLTGAVLRSSQPLLFVENKLLYLLRVGAGLSEFNVEMLTPAEQYGLNCPAVKLSLQDAPPASITIAAYGYMADLSRQAVLRLAYEQEIFCELIVPTRLSPPDPQPFLDSLKSTGKMLTVEEGSLTLGWGAEILARSLEFHGRRIQVARRVAAADTPIPASPALEDQALPSVEAIINACLEMARGG